MIIEVRIADMINEGAVFCRRFAASAFCEQEPVQIKGSMRQVSRYR